LRAAAAFVGGATLMFGARLAGGCTSGHGISGALQLAASGWVFFAAVFVSGVVTTMALLGKVRGNV
ncbi:MAG: YeeE/YedE family protein, partial [Planctomycetales bacterium]|nr:YeeE/YedE family protein [Planctomycetales bacterium]